MGIERRKFNIVDIILLIVVLMITASIIGKILYPDLFRTKPKTYSVSCTLTTDTEISPFISAIEPDDTLFISTDIPFGTVSDIQKEFSQDESKIDYTLTVSCDFTLKDGAFTANDGTQVIVGKILELNSKDTLAIFTVTKTIENGNIN